MKKTLLLIILSYAFTLKAQNYNFSKSTGTYSNLTSPTILVNGNWSHIEIGINIPFTFKYWGMDITDSIIPDDYGNISINHNLYQEIGFFVESLYARGAGKSPVSYKVEGTTPDRILKLEYKNFGFEEDLPGLADSANVQCWFYETSNVIEFRYGPNKVKSTSWTETGPVTVLFSPTFSKFISIEGNPANPTVRTTNVGSITSLTGTPADGTIYKFTPSTFPTGINNTSVKINVVQNKIVLPDLMEVKSIDIYNSNGQIVQSALNAEGINLSELAHGFYVISVETKDGIINGKFVQ